MNRVYYTIGKETKKYYSYQTAATLAQTKGATLETHFEYVSTSTIPEEWNKNHLAKVLERCF